MKHSLLLISLILIFCCFGDSQAERCNIAVRCSTEEKPIWTTSDGLSCEVFRNQCFLTNENCRRLNTNEPELVEINKADCQMLCDGVCPAVYSPVCGYYNEEKKTFANQCQMEIHVCKTGKTFSLFSDGECQ